jgi:hypothetical protein
MILKMERQSGASTNHQQDGRYRDSHPIETRRLARVYLRAFVSVLFWNPRGRVSHKIVLFWRLNACRSTFQLPFLCFVVRTLLSESEGTMTR